jgi:hypothetical protein
MYQHGNIYYETSSDKEEMELTEEHSRGWVDRENVTYVNSDVLVSHQKNKIPSLGAKWWKCKTFCEVSQI